MTIPNPETPGSDADSTDAQAASKSQPSGGKAKKDSRKSDAIFFCFLWVFLGAFIGVICAAAGVAIGWSLLAAFVIGFIITWLSKIAQDLGIL